MEKEPKAKPAPGMFSRIPNKNYALYISIAIIAILIIIIVFMFVLLMRPTDSVVKHKPPEPEDDDLLDDLENDILDRQKTYDNRNKRKVDEIINELEGDEEVEEDNVEEIEITEIENSEEEAD